LHQLDILELVKFFHAYRGYEENKNRPIDDSAESYNERRDRLRKSIQEAVGRLHHRLQRPHNEIHLELNNAVGARDKDTATLEQLEKMLHIAQEMEAGLNGNEDFAEDR
jgi:hypothetical protein